MKRKNSNNKSLKIIKIIFLILYSVLILYLMFFGFNRAEKSQYIGDYRYFFEISRIPLWFPKKISRLWIFSMGNLLAFVPFGILIPSIFNTKYFKFIFFFIFTIFCLEITQMLTRLGSFDLEDILINSLGASIGYIAYKLTKNSKNNFNKLLYIGILVFIMSLILIFIAEIYNKYFI